MYGSKERQNHSVHHSVSMQELAKETFVSITLDILYSIVVIGIIAVVSFSDMSAAVQKITVEIISFLVIKL